MNWCQAARLVGPWRTPRTKEAKKMRFVTIETEVKSVMPEQVSFLGQESQMTSSSSWNWVPLKT